MKRIFIAVVFCLFFQVHLASALTFNITYDTSVTASTNAAQISNAFAYAAQSFSDTFTNAATIYLTVYWGPTGPFTNGISLGRSEFLLVSSSYSEITNALRTHRASAADTNSVASLPVAAPSPTGKWVVAFPEARVLGLVSTTARPNANPPEDGEVGFATNVNYTFDPNNRSVPSKYDFIGVAQHELSEVLGRDFYDLTTIFVPYDLFRFSSSGVRSLDPNATNAYFSVDNGATALRFFYTNQFLGDIQDWKTTNTPDAFDAFVTSGHINPLSTADITAMDVLGYNGLSLVPPHLYVTKTNNNVQLRFVNSPGVSFTVLATTNLATKETTWTALGTASESPPGQFIFTDTTATNAFRFYSVTEP
jgi:hypothetical protein